MENIAIALHQMSYKQLLQEKDQLRLDIINWKQEYDRLDNSSVEQLAISATIAALRIRLANVQREALERRL